MAGKVGFIPLAVGGAGDSGIVHFSMVAKAL